MNEEMTAHFLRKLIETYHRGFGSRIIQGKTFLVSVSLSYKMYEGEEDLTRLLKETFIQECKGCDKINAVDEMKFDYCRNCLSMLDIPFSLKTVDDTCVICLSEEKIIPCAFYCGNHSGCFECVIKYNKESKGYRRTCPMKCKIQCECDCDESHPGDSSDDESD